MSFKIKMKDLNITWPILILKFILPLLSFGLFGQIFLFLILLFDCDNGYSYISEEIKCRNGYWFMIFSPFIAITMIIHILLGLLTNQLYYRSIFALSKNDVLKKTNSINEVLLFFTKIFIIIIFVLDTSDESNHWTLLFLLIIL